MGRLGRDDADRVRRAAVVPRGIFSTLVALRVPDIREKLPGPSS
jgi:hypothetical protein